MKQEFKYSILTIIVGLFFFLTFILISKVDFTTGKQLVIIFFIISSILLSWVFVQSIKIKAIFKSTFFVSIFLGIGFSILGYIFFPGIVKDIRFLSTHYIQNISIIIILLWVYHLLVFLILFIIRKNIIKR
jgi:hypothetical protein